MAHWSVQKVEIKERSGIQKTTELTAVAFMQENYASIHSARCYFEHALIWVCFTIASTYGIKDERTTLYACAMRFSVLV